MRTTSSKGKGGRNETESRPTISEAVVLKPFGIDLYVIQ